MNQLKSPKTRFPYLAITSIPDAAILTGNLTGVFVGTASVSHKMWNWLCRGSETLSGKRTNFLVESLLKAMRDASWNPYSLESRQQPLGFGLLMENDSLRVVVRVTRGSQHLLHIDVEDAQNN
jgi:hypothetical protein